MKASLSMVNDRDIMLAIRRTPKKAVEIAVELDLPLLTVHRRLSKLIVLDLVEHSGVLYSPSLRGRQLLLDMKTNGKAVKKRNV